MDNDNTVNATRGPKHDRDAGAFTLVELLVVIAIISLLWVFRGICG